MSEYGIIASIYDPALHFALKSVRLAILEELKPFKDKRIIDICCGTGNQLKLLAKHGFKDLNGLDLSPSMLKVARKGSPLINIYKEDATRTSFNDDSFDIAIISLALHEKTRESQENMLTETHRILKANGTLLIADFVFDRQTKIVGQIGISLVERIAGGEHFRNFKEYISHKGLTSLIPTESFQLAKEARNIFNGVTVSTYHKV